MSFVQLPVIALPYGQYPGLDSGDAVMLRFDQYVAQVAVGTKAAVDELLLFTPATWATSYSGHWVNEFTLLITAEA